MATLRRAGGTSLMGRDPILISPLVGLSRPASSRSKVLLPHPEGPTSTKNSPSLIVRCN